jgi:hypothetical protein
MQASGVVAAAGSALAAAGPTVSVTLAGWARFGLGLAAMAPAVLGAAAEDPRLPPSAAIAAVTAVGYPGSFSGAPAVGALAESSCSAAGSRRQTAATSLTCVSRMWLPDGSRKAASIPYGRSSGSSVNSTPRPRSSS